MNMYPQYPQQPGQPMYPQQPAPQQYQPYSVQPQMPPQQYYQQPQQPTGVVMANPQLNEMQQALMNYVAQQANQTQVGGFIYTRGAQNQWSDPESSMLVRVGAAFLNHILRSSPGINPQQAMLMAVQQAYDVAVISTLYSMPQMVQGLPQQVLQGLLQGLPMLQQIVNQALPAAGIPPINLTIPGYQVVTQQQGSFQPIAPNMTMPGYQQPSLQQQYAMPMAPTMQQRQPGQQSGNAANLGFSNARPVIPPPAGEHHLGLKPIDIGTLNIGSNRRHEQEDNNLGITARKIDFGNVPVLEPLIQQPVAQPQPVQAAPWVPPPQWNNGVLESHSTPSLAQAIHNQLQPSQPALDLNQMPSDINFDSIMALDTSEEAALFNAPASEQGVMPSMTELFGQTFGANKALTPDPMSQAMAAAYTTPVDTSAYTHHVPSEAVVDLTAGQVSVVAPQPQVRPLSEDGLPDGWLYTERHYDAPSMEFYQIFTKAKRHKSCPWPIGYDRRFCTRLYRYMENGSIEQKIVGVTMDRLKHDFTLIDTPSPTEQIRQAEMADFGPLAVMGVGEAVKIIKDPETTPEIIDEKLGENSIYLVDKPVYALSRQEAILLTAVKVKPLMDNLKKGTHGFETQIREISLITSHPEIEAYLANEHINKLTIDSTAENLMDLAESIRSIRAEGLMSERQLYKVTEYMRDTMNTMLHADYGYSDELELEADNLFEDELVSLIMFMNKSEEDLDILNRIHKNWANVRSRLCTLLTGNALRTAQQQLARRYDLSEEDRETMLAQMDSAVLLQVAYSVTTMARTTKQMRASDNHPAFVTMVSDRPYLHKLMTDIKKRGKASGAVLSKHFIIASDGVELAFTQAGLGNGNTFPTFYVHY